jgi:hypothetical protein
LTNLSEHTLLIGLGHKRRHGKDEAARAIIAARGGQYDIRRYAFADALKREVNEAAVASGGMFNLFQRLYIFGAPLPDGRNIFPPESVRYDTTPIMDDPLSPLGKQVALLQWWGTEYRRNHDQFYWVKKLEAQIAQDKPSVALITDMRFPNEFWFVKSQRGYTVKVTRLGYVEPNTNASNHASENAINGYPFDVEIQVADGQLEDLKSDAVKLFDMIRESYNPPVNFTRDEFNGAEASSLSQVV